MPISKEEAMKAYEARFLPLLEKSCLYLDDSLRKGARIFSHEFFPREVRQQMLDAYKSVGWTIKYTSDQRDGDYYTFS